MSPALLDQSWPVALRSSAEISGGDALYGELLDLLAALNVKKSDIDIIERYRDRLCIYYGEFATNGLQLGPWRHWMFVLTVNTIPPGTDPVLAAQTIGGIAVSKNLAADVDWACGPVTFEGDGDFEIELLSF